jgi:hypothetical protein
MFNTTSSVLTGSAMDTFISIAEKENAMASITTIRTVPLNLKDLNIL